MAGVALLVLLGRVLGDEMPRLPRLGPDDPGQGAAAERWVDFLAQLVEDVVRSALQEILFRPDADLFEFGSSNPISLEELSLQVKWMLCQE